MSTTPSTPPVQEFEYKAEMKQLLHLIIHSLYTHPEIFLRELISNASDALNKVRFRKLTDTDVFDAEAALQVSLDLDTEAHTLTITDSGIGMTREDLIERIGTVASSGTRAFLEAIQAGDEKPDAQLIGQFGVGFYSAFMVAHKISIETRHADPEAQGYRWTSDGTGTYTIEEVDRTSRGTTITLHLKEDHHDFATTATVESIIRKYSNFVDFPIYVGGKQVNTVKAIWRKNKQEVTDDEYQEFYKFLTNEEKEPMGQLHLRIEGSVYFDALLFVPPMAPPGYFREDFEHTLHLYANNVFIQDDCKPLLPEYLRFMRGVVDTEDLPLNVSRETTQSSPVMAKINKILTGRVLGLLESWAKDDADQYQAFFKEFGPMMKTGLTSDFTHRERLIELLRFESTQTEEGALTALADYKERMGEEQKEIYYLMGERRDAVLRNPSLEYFRKNNIEVLLLTDPIDVFTFPHIYVYGDLPFKSIEKADIDLKQDEAQQKEALSKEEEVELLHRFKNVLGDRVEDVIASKRLIDSAATLVVGKEGLDSQVERMMKMLHEEFSGSTKILELNLSHPLLKNLSRLHTDEAHTDLVEAAIWQLYEGALLLEGSLAQPSAYVQRMTTLMVKATG